MEGFWNYLGTAGAVVFVFVALGFCILFHEFGHFLAARMLGLHVDAFSLGFRPFWRKKYKGVEYRIGYLPFGGYVEIPQIDTTGETPKAADGTELRPGTPRERIITAVAGPLFNIISGLLLGCVIWIWGMPQDTPKMREITVLEVPQDCPEYRAGLRPGDVIVKLNGDKFFLSWVKFVEKILYTTGSVELEVMRDGKKQLIRYTPVDNPNAPGSIRREGVGYPFFVPKVPIQVFPEAATPAERAGLKAGDIVVRANGQNLQSYLQFQTVIDLFCGRELPLDIERDGKILRVNVVPEPLGNADKLPKTFMLGLNMTQQGKDQPVTAESLIPGFPAAMSGMMAGDQLLSIDGQKIDLMRIVGEVVNSKKGEAVVLTVKRKDKTLSFTLTPRVVVPAGIGVSMAVYDHPTPIQQLCDTVNMSWQALRGIATGLGNKLGLTENTSTLKPSHMSGPLGIGMVLFTSVRTSPAIGIYMMVVISFALAIFNLMPFPVLDGGHIFFGFIEIIIRRPLPRTFMKVLSYIFVSLLIMLMLFVTFFDIRRAVRRVMPDKTQNQQVDNAPQNP